jgi:outer membrane protein OmpA-like peptidoglycan-associated protein/tetratricopeptide (TPR) repeat protein
MKNLFSILFIFLVSISSAQVDKYLRKGSKALEKNNLEKAKFNYLQAYNLDKTSYEANVCVGYVLSQHLFKYEEALPYLETAYNKSPTDTFPDLLYSLATCYQYVGEFKKAHALFNNLIVMASQDPEQDKAYMIDLKKRKEDCLYAELNKGISFDKNIYVGNLGSKVNTEAPEYVPVITANNELLFTSRRKDFDKEKKSKIDDHYFENIYISKLDKGRPQAAKTYTISKDILKTNPRKSHLSIISASTDGKTMFVFQKNKIYEIKTGDNLKDVQALSKNVNIDFFQNHASVSKDGQTLLFTSEDDRGHGGLDIYKSKKQSDGSWGVPENLGNLINTEHDEDAPYLSDDGKTLYFSSKGHKSFGNYDIYSSTLTNGEWSGPKNLEQPINSSGNDIFMIESDNLTSGYISSYRTGGHGDMDIYKITYLDKFNKECREKKNSILSINASIIDKESFSVKFESTIPSNLKVIAYQWTFNQEKLPVDAPQITQTISITSPGDSVFVKVIAGCDTCIEPVVLCNNIAYNVPADMLPVVKTDEAGKNPYDDKLILSYLNKTQIDALGFDMTPIHFNLNKSNIREDAIVILKKNNEVLSKHPEISVLIYGFADSRGKESYNLSLSKKRAQQVKGYLVSKKVNKKQIEQVNGKGEEFILNKCTEGVICEDPEHEVNRRVEFILFENKK